MKKLLVFTFCTCMATACHAGANNPDKAPAKDQPSVAEQNQKLVDEINSQYDDELIQKMKKDDRVPPRASIQLEVVKNENISSSDVEHSWLFSKAAFERCYAAALARDENATGDVVLALERKNANPELVSFSSEIKTDRFEDCIKNALPRWRMPEGASFEVRVKLRPLPGLTGQDFDKMADEFRNRHHDHDHE